MEWIEVNGVGLRYELAGSAAQTVLLIHELGGALDSFDESVSLFQQQFRTLRYDQRGFGHSEKIRRPIAMSDMVADIIALLDRLGDPPLGLAEELAGLAALSRVELLDGAVQPRERRGLAGMGASGGLELGDG